MRNVFQKLLLKDLGEKSYLDYVHSYQKLIAEKRYDGRKLENKEIFEDIYRKLYGKDTKELKGRLDRIVDAMMDSMMISKHYFFNLLAYLFAILLLVSLDLVPIVVVTASGILSAMFFYKTIQFIVNKFCFIDAHIIIVYKSVLDVLMRSGISRGEGLG